MQVGEDGKKYGLQLPKLKSAFNFEDDDDSKEEESSTGAIDYYKQKQQLLKKNATTKVEKLHNSALEEDPTVFDYDGIYDSMKKEERQQTKKQQQTVTSKPKYIQNLLAEADRKKRENERVKDRLIQKEREAEGDLYKDKEVFLTAGYKKVLEERKLQAEKDKQLEIDEDVTKKKDLSGFHKNLYNNILSTTDDNKDTNNNNNNNNKDNRNNSSNSFNDKSRDYNDRKRDRYTHYYPMEKYEKKPEPVKDNKLLYPRRNDEASIAAARERYLERKANRSIS